jgi:hypothetical protein
MPIPKVNVQFVETIQPNIPDWIDTETSFVQQFDLVTYENDLFLTKQLLKRIYKEVFRISGEVVRENFKYTLTQNWFWTSHENLVDLLKLYKDVSDNAITQDLLLQTVQNIPLRDKQ